MLTQGYKSAAKLFSHGLLAASKSDSASSVSPPLLGLDSRVHPPKQTRISPRTQHLGFILINQKDGKKLKKVSK